MKIYFDVKNQIITRTDRNQVIANSADYLEAEITFSAEWATMEKTMTFKNGNLLYTYVLVNDKILEENHLNLGVGTWKVSIQGVNEDKKIVTNECNLAVNASGWIGSEALPPESIWNQLLVIIQSLHTEVASTAALRSAVQKYIEDNYDALVKEAVIVDDVRAALDDMAEDGTLSDLLAPLVAAGMPEVVADQISAVVATQIGGVVANQIGAVVASQITTPVNQAVKNYCDDNFSGWSGALDRGLAQPLMAAPADMVGAIKSALSPLYYVRTSYVRTTPSNTWTSGYWWNKQANENESYYYSSAISVAEGDVVTVFDNAQFRFIECYDSNGDIIDQESSTVRTYIVPEGAASLRLSTYSATIGTKYPVVRKYTVENKVVRNKNFFTISQKWSYVSTAGTAVLVSHLDNKKNCEYSFTGKFSTFTSLEIGHGKNEFNGIYCVIDGTNITIYSNAGAQLQQFAHGLTFADFISVSIKCGDIANGRGSITIQTNGGYYRKDDNTIFIGCNGDVYFIPGQTTSDIEFSYTLMDARKDVYVFGDSYLSLADGNKWVKYAIEDNDNNMLLCGFGGATSNDEIIPFRMINEVSNPKYCAWLLGMNDPDNGAINANWKTCVDEVIAYCDSHDIELILATIPNVPTLDHTYKNAYVKASGKRYIDFAKAVNAESAGATWYTGMLSNDGVHPTTDGAKALWLRAIMDCPELINT